MALADFPGGRTKMFFSRPPPACNPLSEKTKSIIKYQLRVVQYTVPTRKN